MPLTHSHENTYGHQFMCYQRLRVAHKPTKLEISRRIFTIENPILQCLHRATKLLSTNIANTPMSDTSNKRKRGPKPAPPAGQLELFFQKELKSERLNLENILESFLSKGSINVPEEFITRVKHLTLLIEQDNREFINERTTDFKSFDSFLEYHKELGNSFDECVSHWRALVVQRSEGISAPITLDWNYNFSVKHKTYFIENDDQTWLRDYAKYIVISNKDKVLHETLSESHPKFKSYLPSIFRHIANPDNQSAKNLRKNYTNKQTSLKVLLAYYLLRFAGWNGDANLKNAAKIILTLTGDGIVDKKSLQSFYVTFRKLPINHQGVPMNSVMADIHSLLEGVFDSKSKLEMLKIDLDKWRKEKDKKTNTQ
jgi:hypothetical protein